MAKKAIAPALALMTDFGAADTYVGVMKGVIAAISPRLPLHDITHQVPAGDIAQAAYQLWQSVAYYPSGTVVVAVVDPGVGSGRRALAVKWNGYSLIAPDNGVLTYLLLDPPPQAAVSIEASEYQRQPVSTTFHGRDVFAPAGAHLANGLALEALGPPAQDLVRLPLPQLEQPGEANVTGEIVHIDHFGNAISSLGRWRSQSDGTMLQPWLPAAERRVYTGRPHVQVGDLSLPLRSTFSDVAIGDPVAYVGSEGLVEIAIRQGHAADQFGLATGDPIQIRFEAEA